jgi:hypothetical protein
MIDAGMEMLSEGTNLVADGYGLGDGGGFSEEESHLSIGIA